MKYFKMLCLLVLVGCSRQKTAYETTILLQTWDGNPIANREVRFYKQLGSSSSLDTLLVQASLRTAADGKAILNYEIFSDESMTEFATIYVKDQPLFKSLNFATHMGPSQNKSEKKQFTFKMDSLIPFQMRIIKTDTAKVDFNLYLTRPPLMEGELRNNEIYNTQNIHLQNIGRLDTMINRFVLKNSSSALHIQWSRNTNMLKNDSKLFNAQQYRDSLMTISF